MAQKFAVVKLSKNIEMILDVLTLLKLLNKEHIKLKWLKSWQRVEEVLKIGTGKCLINIVQFTSIF